MAGGTGMMVPGAMTPPHCSDVAVQLSSTALQPRTSGRAAAGQEEHTKLSFHPMPHNPALATGMEAHHSAEAEYRVEASAHMPPPHAR
mgnify:CR=1 FL=1